jgi:hypothetical protein
MTHKDYVKLAGALAEARHYAPSDFLPGIDWAEAHLQTVLAEDNSAFDRDRFHRAASGRPDGRDRVR